MHIGVVQSSTSIRHIYLLDFLLCTPERRNICTCLRDEKIVASWRGMQPEGHSGLGEHRGWGTELREEGALLLLMAMA